MSTTRANKSQWATILNYRQPITLCDELHAMQKSLWISPTLWNCVYIDTEAWRYSLSWWFVREMCPLWCEGMHFPLAHDNLVPTPALQAPPKLRATLSIKDVLLSETRGSVQEKHIPELTTMKVMIFENIIMLWWRWEWRKTCRERLPLKSRVLLSLRLVWDGDLILHTYPV
jgi:hypothetical protein